MIRWILGKVSGLVVGSLGGWPVVVAGAVAVAAIGGYVLWLRHANTVLERDLAQQQVELVAAERDAAIYAEANRRSAESFRAYVEQNERAQALLGELAAASIARDRDIDRILMELEADETADWSNPLSPGLAAVLERLHELAEGTAAAGD